MTKLPFKQHITDLAELLKQQGVQHVIICPGSRNAPMMQVFQRESQFICFSIVDERSAGYVALGMATETRRPVVVITTSGTAVLNLAPAVAEACNQNTPLIILTGDRPAENPPQFTNQRINQSNVFGPNANGFYEIPPDFQDKAHLEEVMHEVAGLIRSNCLEQQGPVHLNLLLHEPLYKKIPKKVMTSFDILTEAPSPPGSGPDILNDPAPGTSPDSLTDAPFQPGSGPDILNDTPTPPGSNFDIRADAPILKGSDIRIDAPKLPGTGFNTSEIALIREHLSVQKKVLILAGMAHYDTSARKTLQALINRYQVAVVAENITNLHGPAMISAPELVLAAASEKELQELRPDLVIAMGGAIVSKRTRLFVQGLESVPVVMLNGTPERSMPGINDLTGNDGHSEDMRTETKNSYGTIWKKLEKRGADKAEVFLKAASFSNITAMNKIMKRVPANTTVHLGNSGTIRYAQLEPARHDLKFQSNRGTSGIDGSLSTAVGATMVSEDPHLAILGDLSFMYDSNALWNRNFPSNLKIIVLNDKGGGIFRLLDGPDRMAFFEEFSVAGHPVALEHMAKAFGMNFLYANNDYTLEKCLDSLFATGSEKVLLEVDTSGSENSGIFKQFYTSIQHQ